MLSWFSNNARARRTALELYGAIVAQSRQPGFFAGNSVADTPEGRSDMIILHLFLVFERLNSAGKRGRTAARALSECFVTDVDDCLREMGVGDLAVPRKVKRAAQAMGERCLAYQRALSAPAGENALAAELATTISGLNGSAAAAAALARYVVLARDRLAALPSEEILVGHIAFPAAPPALGEER